jgi:lysophospholipase L1-like esterase
MEELLPKYKERIMAVTIYFGNNDSTENGSPDEIKIRREANSWVRMVRWFPVGRVAFDALVRISQRDNKEPRVNPREYENNLRQMIALAQRYRIKVIVIEPPRHLSWPPAHLTYITSLERQIQNEWVKNELKGALASYSQGLDCIYRQKDDYAKKLTNAIDQDWIIPRIKTDWLCRLQAIGRSPDLAYIQVPEPWIETEHNAFEDYCHPSAPVHAQIAREIKSSLASKSRPSM